ncbi:FMN-dependent NADH-azoreductase [hydrothermal vent metagenome]|uniref:FMN-dependent NADH-azoreductase n=1 Tax=hydrothermal vent metagenome TaxID=652676 RepID=A0A3B0YNU3_9ZZZZ
MNQASSANRNTEQPPTVLRVDASARYEGSVSRTLSDSLMQSLREQYGKISTLYRDLAASPPDFVDEAWVAANFTPAESRTPEHRATLAASDALVAELQAADILVMGVPLYNFAIPATLKAWVDMVARARLTFQYTDDGVEGLLKGKRAYVVFVSGGVPAGSELDFATGYIRHVLGFIGITDVTIIAADQHNSRGEEALSEAYAQITALPVRPVVDMAAASLT